MISILVWGGISWALVAIMCQLAPRMGFHDIPNNRSLHTTTKLRGAGIGIAITGTLAGYLAGLSMELMLCTLSISLLGLWDDRSPLPAFFRLTAQLVLLIFSGWILALPLTMSLGLVALLTATWWVNLFNFMDGVDALASAETLFLLLASSFLGWLIHPDVWLASSSATWALALAAATAGFLVHNWPPARIFLGDAGSLYLGFTLCIVAAISIQEGWMQLTTWLILAAIFIIDATVTLLSRIIHGEIWWQPHRSHAYQKLAQHWKEHRTVVSLITTINSFILLPLGLMGQIKPEWGWGIVMCVYLILTIAITQLRSRLNEHA